MPIMPPRPLCAHSRWVGFAFAAICVLALGLRFNPWVAASPVDLLEAFSWKVAYGPTVLDTVEMSGRDVHPPLYYLSLRMWMGLLGDSPMALRSFSGVTGLLLIPVVIWLVRLWSGPGSPSRGAILLSTLFVAVSPPLVAVSTDARMYSLLALEAALATACLLEAVRKPQRWLWWWGWAVSGAWMVYTHNYGLFFVAGQGFWLILEAIFRRDSAWRSLVLRRALVCAGFLFLVYLPWVPWLLWQNHRVSLGYWIQPMEWKSMAGLGLQLVNAPMDSLSSVSLLKAVIFLALTVLLIWPWRVLVWERHLACLVAFQMAAVVLLADMSGRSVFLPRYLIHFVPLCLVPLACWTCRMPHVALRGGAVLVLLGFMALPTVRSIPMEWEGRDGYQEAVSYLARNGASTEPVIVTDFMSFIRFRYLAAHAGLKLPIYVKDPRLEYMDVQHIDCAAAVLGAEIWRPLDMGSGILGRLWCFSLGSSGPCCESCQREILEVFYDDIWPGSLYLGAYRQVKPGHEASPIGFGESEEP